MLTFWPLQLFGREPLCPISPTSDLEQISYDQPLAAGDDYDDHDEEDEEDEDEEAGGQRGRG